MTTAGQKWTNWAGGAPGSFTFPILMLEMQKYLSSIGGDEANLAVGTERLFEVDAARYERAMTVYYQGESKGTDAVDPGGSNENVQKSGLEDYVQIQPLAKETSSAPRETTSSKDKEKEETPVVEHIRFEFTRARKPGIYFFQFKRQGEAEGRIETRAFAFNVDTANESDLRRVPTTELERLGGKVPSAGGAEGPIVPSDHKTDLSESGWIYLLFLVILIVEQALAVHLSFHLKGSEAALPAAAIARSPA
jgi:hypothetical protein